MARLNRLCPSRDQQQADEGGVEGYERTPRPGLDPHSPPNRADIPLRLGHRLPPARIPRSSTRRQPGGPALTLEKRSRRRSDIWLLPRCPIGTLQCHIGDRCRDRVSACNPSGSSTSMSRVAVTISPDLAQIAENPSDGRAGRSDRLRKLLLGDVGNQPRVFAHGSEIEQVAGNSLAEGAECVVGHGLIGLGQSSCELLSKEPAHRRLIPRPAAAASARSARGAPRSSPSEYWPELVPPR